MLTVHSSSPGKFVFKSWEVVFMMSGDFKSLLSEQDGSVSSLQ